MDEKVEVTFSVISLPRLIIIMLWFIIINDAKNNKGGMLTVFVIDCPNHLTISYSKCKINILYS